MEQIEFRFGKAHPDTYFHEDLHYKLGLPSCLDTTIKIEHLNSNWYAVARENGDF